MFFFPGFFPGNLSGEFFVPIEWRGNSPGGQATPAEDLVE